MNYRVTRLHDPAILRTFLAANADDRIRYAYMIGDLSAPYLEGSAFYGAYDDQDILRAVQLYYTPITPVPVISAGDDDGIAAIWPVLLAEYDPRRIVFHAQPFHLPLIQRHFNTPQPIPMWRMAISPDQLQLANVPQLATTRRLMADDATATQRLFDSGAADEFMDGPPHISPDMLASRPFCGAFVNGQLVAVAGTHILSTGEGLGAVGFVFTHPAARGQGFASAATAAVTIALFEAGLDLVVLNVKQANTPAIRAYERVGYRRHSVMFEGVALR